MKHIKLIYLIVGMATLLYSCEKEYEDNSRITNFVDLAINGDELVFTPTGTAYADAGAVATESGVPVDITTNNGVDNTTPGAYIVSYSAENSDGYSKSLARSVIVYDANINATDLSGDYLGSVMRNGTEGYGDIPVTLAKVDGLDGVYEISDWISGFYAVGRDYGEAYQFIGYIQINASNEVVFLDQSNPWGTPFDDVVGTYNPVTNKISYSAFWNGVYEFVVELVKN